MNLQYFYLPKFETKLSIEEPSNLLIVMENKNEFYKFFSSLANEVYDGKISLISNDMKEKEEDYIDVCPSFFNIDINNKKNLNALYKSLKSEYKEELKSTILNVDENLRLLFNNIFINHELELYYACSIKEDDILKLMNVRFVENNLSLLDTILRYIKISIELRGIKLFIFFGLYQLLDCKDIVLLLKEAKYLEVSLINIEVTDIFSKEFEKKRILDKDSCLL